MPGRLIRRGCTPLLALLIAGCAQLPFDLPFAPRATPERIDRWIEQHEYDRALRALERVPDDHPDAEALRGRRDEVRTAAERYAERMIGRARRAREDGDWETAFDTLRLAQDRYASSDRIQQAFDRLRHDRGQRIARIERALLLHSTRWRLNELELRRELLRVHPDNVITEWKLQSTRQALTNAFQPIKRCGLRALDDDDLELARRCLVLARRIRDDSEVEAAWRRVQERLAQREAARAEAERQREAARERARVEALVKRGREALAGDDAATAREVLRTIEQSGLERPALEAMAARLRERLAEHVRTLTEQGNRLYRNGNLEEARRTWESALDLDPENPTLRQHIERAERALKKIEELKKKDQPE